MYDESSDKEKKCYLKEMIADLNFFKKSLSRADLQINIENVPLNQIPDLIINKLTEINDKSLKIGNHFCL